ncbi:hypothetical protein AB6A40_010040 [Gnathostoma spinigerum]|uniref:DM domain-containing protein n=1 Tax=Gnathostoma spinigerum TaxID=75299 RepID=A0ABD6ETZ6_9BILA
MVEEKENKQSISPGSSSNSFGDCSSCSSPEVDVVAFTPRPHNGLSSAAASNHDEDQKRYYCQRCLNHGQLHPRKGHKPFCQ